MIFLHSGNPVLSQRRFGCRHEHQRGRACLVSLWRYFACSKGVGPRTHRRPSCLGREPVGIPFLPEGEEVKNIVWSGPSAPECPTFPITKGLTGAAISAREIVNLGDVTADPRYLTAFGTTRSEIFVPVLEWAGGSVVGTVESEKPNAFGEDVQALVEACAKVIRPPWRR